MADKYTDAMNLFQSGLSTAATYDQQQKAALIAQAKAKYDNLQQERNTYLQYAGNKDFPKSIRMQFFNNAAAIDKNLNPSGGLPAIDNFDDQVGDTLDAFGVLDSDKTIKPEQKMLLKRQLIAQQSRKENNLDQTKFLEGVMQHGLGGNGQGQGNYVRQLFTQDGKSFAVLGKVDESGNPVVVPVGADGQIPGGGGDNQPFIKPQLPAEQTEKTGSFAALSNLMGRIRTQITDPKTGQLSAQAESWIGPGASSLQKLKSYTPATDVDFTNFAQLVQDLQNQITYLRSGKQINETEAKRLSEALPSMLKNSKNFIPNLDNFEKTFNNIMAERGQAFQQAGYRNPPVPANPTPTAPTAQQPARTFKVISVRPSGTK